MAAAVSASLAGRAVGGLGSGSQQLGSPAAAEAGTSTAAQQLAPQAGESARRPTKAASGKARPTLAELARAHQARPLDKVVAVAYSRRLRAAGKLDAAAAVLEATASGQRGDRVLLVERGLLALQRGDAERAKSLLLKSAPDEAKDWRALSALGVASSSQGDQAGAQSYFKQALAVSPNNSVVLNNLALSYVLERKVERAEGLLRKASSRDASPPQVTQNLMLVAALQGADVQAVVEAVTEKSKGKEVAIASGSVPAPVESAPPTVSTPATAANAGPVALTPLQPLDSRRSRRDAETEEAKFSVFQQD
jgi:Flp pilus assembly protein TadD